MRQISMPRLAALAVSTTVALAACAGSSGPTADTGPEITTDTPIDSTATTDGPAITTDTEGDDPLDVEFRSEPIEAGPLFGGADENSPEGEVSDDVPGGESAASCAPDGDEACTDIVEEAPTVFEPAAADEPFCSLYADLDGRPFPSDPIEAVTVIRVWIGELRDVATEPIQADLDLLIAALDEAVESGAELPDLDSDSDLEAASDRIEDFIDSACDGLDVLDVPDDGSPVTTPTTVAIPVDDPPLPDGVVIPMIQFDEASNTGRPLFGEDDPTLFDDDFVPAAEDQGFCTALDIVAARPQPTDDVDEIRFADGYARAVLPLAPDAIADDLARLVEWTGPIAEAGEFTEEAEQAFEGDVSDGLVRIEEYVDARCNGL